MRVAVGNHDLLPGFADPVKGSQSSFRGVLKAMSRPGSVVTLSSPLTAPEPLDPATAALALTLMDFDTPLWLDYTATKESVTGYLKFHCGCPVINDPDTARFAIVVDASLMPPLDAFNPGNDLFPDQSATVILQVKSLARGLRLRMSGPGIKHDTGATVDGLPSGFLNQWGRNHRLYPLGVDMILTCGTNVFGLPRSIKMED